MIKLIAVNQEIKVEPYEDETIKAVLKATRDYYKVIGFNLPWISYLAESSGKLVGICSFKGKPVDGCVEVAYFTFPSFENKGFGTAMCSALISLAKPNEVKITARTLPEKNASTSILRKNGFQFSGMVSDPDDGEVYEWVLP